MKKPAIICIFGDSTAWGAWDMEKGGWVNRLWFYAAEREGDDYAEIYNCSISGGTTETILERFENEAKARNADALIFQTGGNDAAYENTPDNFLVAPEKFKSNLEEIVKRARKITDRMIFMDFENCDESKTMPVPWTNIYYANDNIGKYSDLMKKLCEEQGVDFMDISKLENSDFEDGLHPNASGHEKVYGQVKNFLINKGWI